MKYSLFGSESLESSVRKSTQVEGRFQSLRCLTPSSHVLVCTATNLTEYTDSYRLYVSGPTLRVL